MTYKVTTAQLRLKSHK